VLVLGARCAEAPEVVALRHQARPCRSLGAL
jgi:hypothetical protein